MRLTSINVHPVKSTAPRPLSIAPVLPRGLADDRSWVVIDDAGVMVSARELPSLFTIVCDTPGTSDDVAGDLRLRAPGVDELVLGAAVGPAVPVRLFSHDLVGLAAGARADEWLSAVTGQEGLRLVWCDDPTRRRLNSAYAEAGDHTAFADGYPVTLTSQASLRQLDDWILETCLERGEEAPEPLAMQRFRPNLVVDGAEPFAEDDWSAVRVGAVRFRVVKATARCVMTTVDPRTLDRGKEPLRTLARHRRGARGVLFAVDLIPEDTGTVQVGDEVTATVRQAVPGR